MLPDRRPRQPDESELARWIELCENRAAGCRVVYFKMPGMYDREDIDRNAELWDDLAAFLRDLL